MRKNWKTKSWKDFSPSARMWFYVTIVFSIGLLVTSLLAPSGIVPIPEWVILIWLVGGAYAAYRLASSVGMLNDDDNDDDDDDYDDPQSLSR